MLTMGRPRSFDWAEARRLHASGLSYAEIARRFGVSDQSVGLACDQGRRERARALQKERFTYECVDCGGDCAFNPWNPHGKQRCRACDAKHRTKVRGGKAYCPTCKKWRLLKNFSPSAWRPSRGVHSECKSCQAIRKREWRRANPGREAATSRRYREKRGAAA